MLSLTTVARPCTGSPDHVAIIDTRTDTVVRRVGIAGPGRSSGTHGANWQPKLGGGYYLTVANQHSNVMTTLDPDPNGDGSAADAAVVGRTILRRRSLGDRRHRRARDQAAAERLRRVGAGHGRARRWPEPGGRGLDRAVDTLPTRPIGDGVRLTSSFPPWDCLTLWPEGAELGVESTLTRP